MVAKSWQRTTPSSSLQEFHSFPGKSQSFTGRKKCRILLTRPDIFYIFGNVFCTTPILLLVISHALLFYCKALCCWSRDQKVWPSFQLGQTNVYYFIGYHNSARYIVFKILFSAQVNVFSDQVKIISDQVKIFSGQDGQLRFAQVRIYNIFRNKGTFL